MDILPQFALSAAIAWAGAIRARRFKLDKYANTRLCQALYINEQLRQAWLGYLNKELAALGSKYEIGQITSGLAYDILCPPKNVVVLFIGLRLGRGRHAVTSKKGVKEHWDTVRYYYLLPSGLERAPNIGFAHAYGGKKR